MARRSKRKQAVATRFSARKQARKQEDAEIYGQDYGVLPSGACVRSLLCACVWVSLIDNHHHAKAKRSLLLTCCLLLLRLIISVSHTHHFYLSLSMIYINRLIHGESLSHSRAVGTNNTLLLSLLESYCVFASFAALRVTFVRRGRIVIIRCAKEARTILLLYSISYSFCSTIPSKRSFVLVLCYAASCLSSLSSTIID